MWEGNKWNSKLETKHSNNSCRSHSGCVPVYLLIFYGKEGRHRKVPFVVSYSCDFTRSRMTYRFGVKLKIPRPSTDCQMTISKPQKDSCTAESVRLYHVGYVSFCAVFVLLIGLNSNKIIRNQGVNVSMQKFNMLNMWHWTLVVLCNKKIEQ